LEIKLTGSEQIARQLKFKYFSTNANHNTSNQQYPTLAFLAPSLVEGTKLKRNVNTVFGVDDTYLLGEKQL
jgi:hypothetical protein